MESDTDSENHTINSKEHSFNSVSSYEVNSDRDNASDKKTSTSDDEEVLEKDHRDTIKALPPHESEKNVESAEVTTPNNINNIVGSGNNHTILSNGNKKAQSDIGVFTKNQDILTTSLNKQPKGVNKLLIFTIFLCVCSLVSYMVIVFNNADIPNKRKVH